MTFLAQRVTASPQKSYGMAGRAAAFNGDDYIHLELGRPCHDTPDCIKQATIQALLAGKVHYGDLRGEPRMRNALAQKLRRFNRIEVDAEQVLVTNGLTQASFAAFMATINPGDEVILLDPYYPQHVGKVALAGGIPVFAPLDAANDFSIDPALHRSTYHRANQGDRAREPLQPDRACLRPRGTGRAGATVYPTQPPGHFRRSL